MMGLEKVVQVLAACAMLHNAALRWNIPLVPAGDGLGPHEAVPLTEEEVQGAGEHHRGTALHEDVIREYFDGW